MAKETQWTVTEMEIYESTTKLLRLILSFDSCGFLMILCRNESRVTSHKQLFAPPYLIEIPIRSDLSNKSIANMRPILLQGHVSCAYLENQIPDSNKYLGTRSHPNQVSRIDPIDHGAQVS